MKKSVKSKYRSDFPGDFVFDYKDPVTLSRFLMEGGKITPSRISKLSMSQQRQLTRAIKKARNISLLPIGSLAYDLSPRAEQISAKPFDLN